MSGVLWIPTIFVLYVSGKPFGVWFGNQEASGSPMDRNFLLILFLIGFFLLIKRRVNWSRIVHENIWLILILGFMLFSILWSDIPFISFKRWSRELIAIVMAFLVLTERNPVRAVGSVFRRLVYIYIPFSLLLIKYFPDYGVFYGRHDGMAMWVGVTLHKQGLGMLCSLSVFFLIWSLVTRWRGHNFVSTRGQILGEVFIIIITIWLLTAGGEGKTSATAIGSLCIGIIMFFYLLWMKRYGKTIGAVTLMAIIAGVIIFGIITVMFNGSTMGLFTSSFSRDNTLTGRTDIWAAILPIAMESPIWGCGIGGFWIPSRIEIYGITECHNGYLELILELGFIGILLFSFFMLSCCRKAVKELDHDFDSACFGICFLLMTVIHNVTESSLNTFTSQLMTVILFLSVSYTMTDSNALTTRVQN